MKNAIVTGCLGGIGKAVAEIFLENGYRVFGMGRTPADKARATITHPEFYYLVGDLSVSADRANLIDFVLKTGGQIDVLVNVAGVAPRVRADLLEMSEESYDYVMDINAKGTFFLTQAVANSMINNPPVDGIRGYICNTSSLSAYAASVNRGEYCVSKAGVSMMTKLFATRLAEYGIPVNETRPGIIATPMTETVTEKYDRLIGEGLLPIKRWGQPEDIAKATLALCNGSLPYVTGVSLDVDGGFHLQRL